MYEAVIGLEVHAQLNTASKLFSGDATRFDANPNAHVSPITLGHPGTLPRMNKELLNWQSKWDWSATVKFQHIIISQERIISMLICRRAIKYHNIPHLSAKEVQ